MIRKLICYILLVSPVCLFAQESVLEQYISEGLNNNLALKQKEADYQRSLQALNEAISLFYPDISFNARYSVAEGGRTIVMPLGDLMNDVYTTLNYLTASDDFPLIKNEEFRFLRPTEHETKMSIVQPIFDPKIYYNHQIKKDLAYAEKADAETYRRELVAEIKTAYFNYMKTLRLLELVDDTKEVLEENLRVNESLYRNQKVTIDNVYRSKAELSKLEQNEAEAEKSRQVAAAYLNFLLNRSLDTELLVDAFYDTGFIAIDLGVAQNLALSSREELVMLKRYSSAATGNISLNKSRTLPSVFAAVDYGYQGEKYKFTGEYDYMLASLVLRWDLFHGFQNRARVSQAKVEREIRETQLEEVKNQISLEVIRSFYDLEASEKSIIAAREELNSARNAFKVVERKYGEGQANLIEFIDTRTTMTNANARLIINQYDYHIKYAEFERVAGLYPFDN